MTSFNLMSRFLLTCFFLAVFGMFNLLISYCANVNCRQPGSIVIHHFHIDQNTPCPPPPPPKKKGITIVVDLSWDDC